MWTGWLESRELRQPSYAERIYAEHLFRTRANTWSNLAFVVVGFYALALGCRDLRRPTSPDDGYVIATPAMSLLFGAACCLLGFGSGFYHASLTRWGQQLDVASMYPPLLVCIAISLGRRLRRLAPSAPPHTIPLWTILVGLVVVTAYLLYRFKWSMSSGTVLKTLILITTAGALVDAVLARGTLRFRWLVWSTLALVAAIVCRQLDVAKKFSGPDAWLQGHALWHVLTALSLACAYAYHRSEKLPANPV
ncbi:MAG: ceramidase domain-containing protein [Devosia sp.]